MPAMTLRPPIDSPLSGRRVAVAESRQLDVLAALFERRQAEVLRIPLVSIHDSPDQDSVQAWLRRFVDNPPHYLILLTGEGLRRLRRAATRGQLEDAFREALARVQIVCRGPKPGRALKEMGLEGGLRAAAPTTPGVIETLESLPLTGLRVAVQLYGEDPNPELMDYLASRELADCDPVAPYVYGSAADSAAVASLIGEMAAGRVDLLVLTSKPQLGRLLTVAEETGLQETLQTAWTRVRVAAVGPVLAERLVAAGVRVDIMPEGAWFMKPLLRAAERAFAEHGDAETRSTRPPGRG